MRPTVKDINRSIVRFETRETLHGWVYSDIVRAIAKSIFFVIKDMYGTKVITAREVSFILAAAGGNDETIGQASIIAKYIRNEAR